MIRPPRQTADYFLPVRIGGSSYQTVISLQSWSHPRRGPLLQGPLRACNPTIDLPISPFSTTQRNPTQRGCRPTSQQLLLRPATCPTGCLLHSLSPLNREETKRNRDQTRELTRLESFEVLSYDLRSKLSRRQLEKRNTMSAQHEGEQR
jgi:hypothetical protein